MATSTFTQLQSFVLCPRPTTTFLKFVPCLMRIRGRGGNQLAGLHLLLLNAVHFLEFFKCLLPASRTSTAWLQWPVEVLSFSLDEHVTVTLSSVLASSQVLHWTSETAPCYNDRICCQSAVLKHNATSTTDNCHRNVMIKTIVMYTEMHLRRTSSFYITGIENGQTESR